MKGWSERARRYTHLRNQVLVLGIGVLLLSFVAAPAGAAPNEGETGNKSVSTVSIFDIGPIPCEDGELFLDIMGWEQTKSFEGENNRNAFLTVFHTDLTFRNEATGESWTFRDRGPDKGYIDQDGNFVLTLSGRSSGSGVIGHTAVIEWDFANPEIHGNLIYQFPFEPFGLDALACDALT